MGWSAVDGACKHTPYPFGPGGALVINCTAWLASNCRLHGVRHETFAGVEAFPEGAPGGGVFDAPDVGRLPSRRRL
jgi:hypothetical protein